MDATIDTAALEGFLHDPNGPVARDLERRAIEVETAAKRLLSQHGSGRVYRRRNRVHQASAPGQPPAPDTGLLRASVTHQDGSDAAGLYQDIGSALAYALYLELGTRHIAPRPWLRPALEAGRG